MRVRSRERGASLPETAIVMAVLLALILGIMEFGRVMYTYAFVAQLARQGARWAIVRGSQCTLLDHCNAQSTDIQNFVRGLSVGATDPTKINVTATWPPSQCPPGVTGNSPGCVVSVNVQYQYKFLSFISAGSIGMSSTSQMVISQ